MWPRGTEVPGAQTHEMCTCSSEYCCRRWRQRMTEAGIGWWEGVRPWRVQGGDVYATGHREGRLASPDPRMTSLDAQIGSGKSQSVNKAAATAAICRRSRWLVVSAITGCIVSSRMHICAAAGPSRAAAGLARAAAGPA